MKLKYSSTGKGLDTSVGQITVDVTPFAKTPVIEEFEIVSDDKRNDTVGKALLEHHKAPYTSISVLEGMNDFEFLMKVDNVLQRFLFLGIVGGKKFFHSLMNLFRRAGNLPSYLVGKPLIITDIEPILSTVGRPGFQGAMQLFDKRFRESFLCPVYNKVDAAEVVGCLYDIIDIYTFVRNADGVGFENVACLLVGKPARVL